MKYTFAPVDYGAEKSLDSALLPVFRVTALLTRVNDRAHGRRLVFERINNEKGNNQKIIIQ